MTVLKDLDRFHLVMVTLDRLPQLKDRTAFLNHILKTKIKQALIGHNRHGYNDRSKDDSPYAQNAKDKPASNTFHDDGFSNRCRLDYDFMICNA